MLRHGCCFSNQKYNTVTNYNCFLGFFCQMIRWMLRSSYPIWAINCASNVIWKTTHATHWLLHQVISSNCRAQWPCPFWTLCFNDLGCQYWDVMVFGYHLDCCVSVSSSMLKLKHKSYDSWLVSWFQFFLVNNIFFFGQRFYLQNLWFFKSSKNFPPQKYPPVLKHGRLENPLSQWSL